ILDRASAGGGGRGRGDLLCAGGARPDRAADPESGRSGAGNRHRPGRQRRGAAQDRRGAVQQLWLWRHQRDAGDRQGPRLMWRGIASDALTLLIVLLVAVAVAVAWGRNQYQAPGPSEIAQCVEIPQGARLNEVSKQLEAQGVITSPYIMRTGADYAGKAGQLKFGSYLVPPHASMEDVVDVITA